jgi:3-(methylthio)propanoyl-CoA dehydrogenase
VGRKLLREDGSTLRALMADMGAEAARLEAEPALAAHGRQLAANLDALGEAMAFLLAEGKADPALAQAAALPFLHLMGLVCAGWRVAQAARAAQTGLAGEGHDPDYLKGVLAIADCWFTSYAPQVSGWLAAVLGAAQVNRAPAAALRG